MTESEPFPAKGIFAGLSAEDVEAVARIGSPVTFQAGTALFEVGEQADAMFVLTEGEARVEVGGRFHVLGAGDVVGEMAVLARGTRIATVRAESDVMALRFEESTFQAFLMDHPAVALSMMKQLVLRLREVEQRIDAWMA
jgi:CRP-like cAMP-binding protein